MREIATDFPSLGTHRLLEVADQIDADADNLEAEEPDGISSTTSGGRQNI
jgi:hypothetical protein